jgi:serine/threonine protein kinase
LKNHSEIDIFGPGDLVDGRYRVVCLRGKGGTGEVYEAEALADGERVALKTLLPRFFDSATVVTRLERECEYSQRINHPNVLAIREVFRIPLPQTVARTLPRPMHSGTLPCIVMEFLDGETLADHMEQGKVWDTVDAKPLACQIASALAAAHQAGIVHRDLKPDNIFLVPKEDGSTHLVLTDFGVARSSLPTGEDSLTASNVLPGTPRYMAPEQLELEKAMPASDLYTFGLVMFEMITGKAPFMAPTPIQMVFMRVEQAAPSPRKYVPDLDPVWEEVILRCLERNPQNRYANADEIIRRIDGTASEWLKPDRGGFGSRWWWALLAFLALSLVVTVLSFGN